MIPNQPKAAPIVQTYPATWAQTVPRFSPAPEWVPPRAVPPGAVPPYTPPPRPGPGRSIPAGPEGTSSGEPVRPPRPQRGTLPPRPKPPERGERERKGKARERAARVAAMAFNFTEACDLVDAMFEALPKWVQRGTKEVAKQRLYDRVKKPDWIPGRDDRATGANCADKFAALYYHWDKINVNVAVKNFLKNMIEDALVGGKSALLDQVRKNLGLGATRALEEALEPYIPDTQGGNATQLGAKELDKALEAGWKALVGPGTGYTVSDLQVAIGKSLSLQ